jgi:hypothetical protein
MSRIAALALAVPLSAFAAADAFQQWTQQHQAASAALAQWVDKHPNSATEVFRWDGQHPEQVKSFVEWAVDNKNDDATAFHTKHQDWPDFQQLLDKHRLALNDFAGWARKFPDDAKALMAQPRALE